MPIAEFSLTDALITTLSVFFFMMWIWIVITILSDLFRDHETSGWAKAGWMLFLIVLPIIGSLAYMVARGKGMQQRAVRDQNAMQQQFDAYVREAAGGASPADELNKLAGLRDAGTISAEEFNRMKAKLVS